MPGLLSGLLPFSSAHMAFYLEIFVGLCVHVIFHLLLSTVPGNAHFSLHYIKKVCVWSWCMAPPQLVEALGSLEANRNPFMSPGLAPDDMLRGLPPVHIIVSLSTPHTPISHPTLPSHTPHTPISHPTLSISHPTLPSHIFHFSFIWCVYFTGDIIGSSTG